MSLKREHKQLMWWFFLYFITSRIYIAADSYLFTKIYHVMGVSLQNMALIYRLAYRPVTDKIELLFWKMFLPYQMACVLFFTYIQFTEDHAKRKIDWGSGFKWSGAMAKSILLGVTQEAVPVTVAAIIFYFIWERGSCSV